MNDTNYQILLDRWRNGEATAEDLAELEAALRAAPERRRQLVAVCLDDAQLAKAFALAEPRIVPAANPVPQPRRRSRWAMPAVVAATLLIASFAGLYWMLRPTRTEVSLTTIESGQILVEGKVTQRVPEGKTFEVAANAPAQLRLQDGSELEFSAGSQAALSRDQQQVRVDLTRGSGSFRVVRAAESFAVKTPVAQVTTLGTEFSVKLLNGEAIVSVRSGKVRVDAGSVNYVVAQGQERTFTAEGEKINPETAPEHLLLIFAGQSNMEGKGTANTASKLTEKEKATIPNVKGFYCNALPDKSKADPWGLKLYDQKGKFWFNWATWKDATFPAVNGTWQDYAYWKGGWKGTEQYDHGDKGEFWYLGLNPGEPWSNAAKFTSGETVQEYGPEYEVARAVAAAHPKVTIYIVKYAPGGTALADQWDLNDTWKGYGAYAAMKQWVDCALAAEPKAKVAGFFWLQGESDAVKGDYAKDYESNLTELFAKVRKDFNAPKLPVVIAKIHPGHTERNYGTVWSGGKKGIDAVRAAQAKVAAAVGNADVVETSDLKLLTKEWNQKKGKDRKTFNDAVLVDLMEKDKYLAPVHFDADGIRTIGKRMGEAWLKLHGKDTPPKKVGENTRSSRAYYFSAKGNDESDGSTPARAWRSFDKLRGVDLVAGDEIVLAEGEEFKGGIAFLPDVGGTAAKPIVIRGGGKRRATIIADDSPAIEATSGGIEIRDLILKGNPVVPEGKKPVSGIRFYTDDATGKRHSHIRIERVEVSNFSGDGVSIGSWHDKQPGYDDVIVSEVNAHDNGATGITLFGKRDPEQKTYPHRKVTIRDSVASKNKSGSGIVLGGVQGGAVEYCFASENIGKSGGVALWAYDCNKVTFRHCIACGTRTEGKDGGGFDLDGGCIECVVEHCLSYENHGPGYMHCDYPKAGVTKGNIIRSCISINDGRREKGAAFGFGFVAWGAGLDECTIEKCLAVVNEPVAKKPPEGLLFVSLITGFADKADKTHIRGCSFRNNIAFNTAKDVPLVSNNLPAATVEDVRFESNSYRVKGVEPLFVDGGKRYATGDAWRQATGQETRDGKSTAAPVDQPAITVPAEYRVRDPRKLDTFSLYDALPR
jgi:ferric-dicitrate binding protein FerR (iron transport regulator)